MKLWNKRIISSLLAFVMFFSMVPMTAFATEETEVTEFGNAMEDTGEIEDSEESEVTESSDTTEETEATETTEAEESEIIHEHSYEAVVTEPTCTEQGYTAIACHCNKTFDNIDYKPELGHVEEGIPAKEPTCYSTGLTTGKKATIKGYYKVAKEACVEEVNGINHVVGICRCALDNISVLIHNVGGVFCALCSVNGGN